MAETNDMKKSLMSAPDLDRFLTEHRDDFAQESAADYLNLLFSRKNVTKAALAKNACMSEVYLHQVFAGKRNPSRNRIICICFGLEPVSRRRRIFLSAADTRSCMPRSKEMP